MQGPAVSPLDEPLVDQHQYSRSANANDDAMSQAQRQNQGPGCCSPPRTARMRLLSHYMKRAKAFGYAAQVLSFGMFVLFMTNEIASITSRSWCENEVHENFAVGLVPLWIASGFVWEYTLPLLGGRLYFRWGGPRCVLSLLLHLFLTVASILVMEDVYDMTLGCERLKNSELIFLAAYYVAFGFYLMCLRQNLGPMVELRDALLSFESTPADLSAERVQETFHRSLELTGVVPSNGICPLIGSRVRADATEAADEWRRVVHRMSKHVSLFPCCGAKAMNPAQFRRFTAQMAHCLSPDCDGCAETVVPPPPITSFALVRAIVEKWIQCPREFVTCLVFMVMAATVAPLQALYLGNFVDHADRGDLGGARGALIGWSLLAGLNPLVMLALSYCQSRMNTKTAMLCRQRALDAVIRSHGSSSSLSPGEIVDVFTSQTGRVEVTLITSTYTMLFSTIKIITATVSALQLNVVIAGMFFCLLPIMYSVDDLTKNATGASQTASRLEGRLASNFASLVDCLPSISACGAGEWASGRIEARLLELSGARQRSIFCSGSISVYYLFCGAVYTLIIVVPFGMMTLESGDSELVGNFVTLVSLTATMTEPLNRLGGFMREASNSAGCIRKVDGLIASGADEGRDREEADCPALPPLAESIEVKDVRFRYDGSPTEVLKGVNVSFRRGSYNVLCGLSGSGKTTLINLLMRDLRPSKGSIEWDGIGIYDASRESFRGQVSVMFQRTMILEGSIRENILFGLADGKDGRVEEAAAMAEIAGIVAMLPDGYDTMLGGGSSINMSGGQLQRICLARALYRRPTLLLLDEATSALDPETQASIVGTMVRLRDSKGLTIVSISHSTSTSVDADQIVVLDGGTVAERGTHEELAGVDGGIFRGMVLAGRSDDGDEDEDGDGENARGRSEKTNSTVQPVSTKDLMMELKRERDLNESKLQVDCS